MYALALIINTLYALSLSPPSQLYLPRSLSSRPYWSGSTTCSTDFTAGQRDALKEQLTRIILRLLAENEELHYYQGLHDVALTLLLVMGEDIAFAIMAVITRYHIRCDGVYNSFTLTLFLPKFNHNS